MHISPGYLSSFGATNMTSTWGLAVWLSAPCSTVRDSRARGRRPRAKIWRSTWLEAAGRRQKYEMKALGHLAIRSETEASQGFRYNAQGRMPEGATLRDRRSWLMTPTEVFDVASWPLSRRPDGLAYLCTQSDIRLCSHDSASDA